MNWNNGFSSIYYATVVDPQSWRDILDDGSPRFEIMSGDISRTSSGLRESADIQCRNRRPRGEQWIRIYLDTRQGGSSEHTAIFTGLATSPERDIDGNREDNPLECYSVLKACEDVMLPKGWFAPANSNGAEIVKTLLEETTPAPVEISGVAPKLREHIVAEADENHLSMADKVLMSMGWRLRIQGDGRIVICPPATEISATFDSIENDSIRPQVNIKDDWYSCPNVFRATSGDVSATARDDSPDSPLSTVNRGREVWANDNNCDLSDAESLGDYARRRLAELQRHSASVSYSRRYNPVVLVTDKIRLNYPKQDIIGDFVVVSQKVSLGFGAETAEEVERELRI